jgi:hypothetical protein
MSLVLLLGLASAAPAAPEGGAPAPSSAPAAGGAPRRNRPAAPSEWPVTVRLGEASAVLDAPQADSFDGTLMRARGSFRIRRPEDAEPATGRAYYEADVSVDRTARVVTLTAVRVSRIELPDAPLARQERIAARFAQDLSRRSMKLPLDDVLASAKLAVRRDEARTLGTDAPRIVFESVPAILVVYDGEPRFHAVEGSFLERALNTPFLVLRDPVANGYYLDGGTVWFRAPAALGPWGKADMAPPEALRIARADRKEAGIREADVEQAKAGAGTALPKILTATEPTELVVTDGAPRWAPLVPGALESLANTESNVFRTPSDGRVFVVLSGRWYAASSSAGPWTFVEAAALPPAFARIPADSPKSAVLAFVPGTAKAREALRDAGTPRTAAVRRADAHASVTWDGDPKFEAVPGTQVEYGVNTPDQILKVRGRYYVCDQGVWFASDRATGPWKVADAVPDEDLQAIPPESPVYNTRFATVYDATPDVVYVGYTPAYLGSYAWNGGVVYGTGWVYRPWWGAYYYPRPWTWGFARWGPWGGWHYGFGWGPAWAGFRYGFGFGWGARWCGPGGFYRPVYGNVNVARTVNVTRNVYNSGANTTRATPTQSTARSAPKTSTASKSPAAKSGGAGAKGGQGNAGKGAAAQGKAASGKAGAKGSHAGGGHAGGHGGGGKKGK